MVAVSCFVRGPGVNCNGYADRRGLKQLEKRTLLEMLGKLHWVNENWVYVGQLFPNFLLYAFTQHVSKDKCLHNGQPALGK